MALKLTPDVIRALLELRRRQDPLRNVTLSATQKACHESTARFRALIGVNRGGKTALEMMEVAMAARRIHPYRTTTVNGTYLIFAPSRDQLIDPIGKKLLTASELKGPCFDKPMIPAHEIESIGYIYGAGERTPHVIQLKNGHKILLLVSGDKNVWKRVQGKGMVLGVVVDEAAGSLDLLAEASTRLLDANSDEKVQEQANGGWMLWGFTETMATPAVDHYLKLCSDPDAKDFASFRLDADSNPAISKVEREKLLDILGEDQYKIRMVGTGSAADALSVLPQFSEERHMLKEDYQLRDDDNIWVGYDPGTNYTGIVIAVVSRDSPRLVKVIKCWETRRQTIVSDVNTITDYLRGRNIEAVVYDPAARKVEKTGESVFLQLQRKFQESGVKIWRGLCMGRNRYEDSVPVLRYYLDPKPGDLTADPLLKLNPSKESGCQLLRAEIKGFRFKSLAAELKESGIQAGNDHCLHGDTEVITDSGVRKISDMVGTTGKVLTHKGRWREYRDVRMTRRNAKCVSVNTNYGASFVCTPEHLVWCGANWIPACNLDSMRYADSHDKDPIPNGSGVHGPYLLPLRILLPARSEGDSPSPSGLGGCSWTGSRWVCHPSQGRGQVEQLPGELGNYDDGGPRQASHGGSRAQGYGAGGDQEGAACRAGVARLDGWLGVASPARVGRGEGQDEGAGSNLRSLREAVYCYDGYHDPNLLREQLQICCSEEARSGQRDAQVPYMREGVPGEQVCEKADLWPCMWGSVASVDEAGSHAVYNLEVDEDHSFTLSCGVSVHNCLDGVRYLVNERPCWVDRGLNREDPNWGQRPKIEDRVLDEYQLREQRKMEMSAKIGRGDLRGLPSVGRNPRIGRIR